MKTQTILSAILLMICSLYTGVNYARGHHGGHYGGHWRGFHGYHGHSHARSSLGFYFNLPLYPYGSSFYYPETYYPYLYQPFYYPREVPSTPPVYIQQPVPTAPQYPSGYWYYCTDPEGYYPNVQECPLGWLQVNPLPPVSR